MAEVPDEGFGQRLAASIVLDDDDGVDLEAVQEYVRHRLARFCVPRDVCFVAALHQIATGKVVRRQLYTDQG